MRSIVIVSDGSCLSGGLPVRRDEQEVFLMNWAVRELARRALFRPLSASTIVGRARSAWTEGGHPTCVTSLKPGATARTTGALCILFRPGRVLAAV